MQQAAAPFGRARDSSNARYANAFQSTLMKNDPSEVGRPHKSTKIRFCNVTWKKFQMCEMGYFRYSARTISSLKWTESKWNRSQIFKFLCTRMFLIGLVQCFEMRVKKHLHLPHLNRNHDEKKPWRRRHDCTSNKLSKSERR